MYCLLEPLTVVCVVMVLAMILFVVGAAVIVVSEGIRCVLGLSAKYVRQVASFSTAIQKGRKVAISYQRGSYSGPPRGSYEV